MRVENNDSGFAIGSVKFCHNFCLRARLELWTKQHGLMGILKYHGTEYFPTIEGNTICFLIN